MRLNISMQQINLRCYFSTTSKCLNKFNNNHYKVLGIEQSASQTEIKKAFYQLSKKYHPDALSSGDKRKFIQICEAYETLRNEQKRQIYDKMPENWNERTKSNYEYAQNHAKNHHNSWEHQKFYQTRKNQSENDDDWKDFNEKINYDEEEKKFRKIYEEEKKFRKIYEEEKKFRKIIAIGMLVAFALSWLGLFIEQRWLTILAFISIIALLLCQIGFFKMNLAKLIEFLVLLALMGFMLYPNDIKVD